MPRLTVSAVVATYQRRRHLPGFLDALLQDARPDEVIVAVDGSDDGSMDDLRERAAHDPRVVPLWVDHRGQFGALHAGAEAATGDVVLFLDDDVRASPGLVDAHRRRHEARPGLVVQGYMPVALEPDPGAGRWATVLYATEYERRCRAWEDDPTQVLRHLWGGNLSLRRDDYLALGYTPLVAPPGGADVRLYNQDRDLGLHCEAAGLEGCFDRAAAATHLHERTLDGFLRDTYGQGACTVLLHHLHPELVAPPGAGLSRTAGASARLAARPGLATRAADAAAAAVRTSVRAGSLRGAVTSARLARSIQIARGARAMQDLLAAEPTAAGTSAEGPATSRPAAEPPAAGTTSVRAAADRGPVDAPTAVVPPT